METESLVLEAGGRLHPLTPETEKPVDLLNRRPIIHDMMKLLKVISEAGSSCTFALNGAWGSGKTFVLNMLMDDLRRYEGGSRYLVFHYNCWQYDYYEEPLVAIVSSMLDCLDEQTHLLPSIVSDTAAKAAESLKSVLEELVKDFVKTKYGVDISKLLSNGQAWLQAAREQKEQDQAFDEQRSLKKAIRSMHEALNLLTKDQTVVIVVDELDRCLPDYAIKVLERLHHLFFNVPKTVVILGIDREQLKNSIKQIFGSNTQEDKYLSKIINFQLTLEDPKYDTGFLTKYSSYFDLFDDTDLINVFDKEHGLAFRTGFDYEAFFRTLFHGIEARKMDQIFNRCKTIHRILFPEVTMDHAFMCAEVALVVASDVYGINYMPIIYDPYDLSGFTICKDIVPPSDAAAAFLDNFKAYLETYWKGIGANSDERPSRSHNSFVFRSTTGLEELLIWYLNGIFIERRQNFSLSGNQALRALCSPNRNAMKDFNDLRKIIR